MVCAHNNLDFGQPKYRMTSIWQPICLVWNAWNCKQKKRGTRYGNSIIVRWEKTHTHMHTCTHAHTQGRTQGSLCDRWIRIYYMSAYTFDIWFDVGQNRSLM